MKKKQIENLMSALIGVSAFLMLLGALFELQHFPYGNEIFSAGSVMYIIVSLAEIKRLKKFIKKMEGSIPEIDN